MLAGTSTATSGYLPANPYATDSHTSAIAQLTGPGTSLTAQLHTIQDTRTGVIDIIMPNSGFYIDRTVTQDPSGAIHFTVSKSANYACTYNMCTSAASVTPNTPAPNLISVTLPK